MSFDFPTSPAENQEYTPAGGPTYVFKTPRWMLKVAGFPEAPNDGIQYGRQSLSWTAVVDNPTWSTLAGKPTTFPPTVPIAQTDVSGLTASLAGKEPTISGGNATQYWRGDKTWQTLPTGGGVTEAPNDGQQYGRQSQAWTAVVPNPTWITLSGKPTTFPPTVPIAWTDISGQPATYPPTVPIAWSNITGQPATYPPTLPIAESDVTNLPTDLAAKAPLASPNLSGVPTAPTPTAGDSSAKLATTAFVGAAVTAGIATVPAFPEAPNDANAYGRKAAAWVDVAEEAPNDGKQYARKSGAWAEVVSGFTDAPSDGTTYGRRNTTWVPVVSGASVSDTAPSSPGQGQLWWNSANGNLYISYNDGSSTQWVQINSVGV